MSFAVTAACGSTQSSNLAQESAISRSVTTELVAAIDAPTAFAIRPGEPSSIIYVASQKGEISRVDLATNTVSEFASFRGQTTGTGERGLLGLAFSRDGNELYAHFTDLDGNTNIVAVEIRNGVPDLATMRTLLFVEQPYSNHNGGQLLVDAAGT